ncbi:MAG: hypothetical protein ABR615_06390 [Pseudonocardiaceae bacterium]|nr:hypothetical protein [Actinomycetota bacterium]
MNSFVAAAIGILLGVIPLGIVAWRGTAVLRVTGGVFYGLGDPPSEAATMAEVRDRRSQEPHPSVDDHPVGRAGGSRARRRVTTTDVVTGVGTAAASLVLALMALYWRRLPVLRRGVEPGTGLVGPARRFQSGVVNDYVTWMVVGLACIGGALAFAIR